MSELRPDLGGWYQDLETGKAFQIVSVDEEQDTINIQYANGDIGEYDFASWGETALTGIEAPEDWSAPFDDVETDDLGYSDTDRHEPDPNELTLDDLLNEDESYWE